jgi:hypothetical protein
MPKVLDEVVRADVVAILRHSHEPRVPAVASECNEPRVREKRGGCDETEPRVREKRGGCDETEPRVREKRGGCDETEPRVREKRARCDETKERLCDGVRTSERGYGVTLHVHEGPNAGAHC